MVDLRIVTVVTMIVAANEVSGRMQIGEKRYGLVERSWAWAKVGRFRFESLVLLYSCVLRRAIYFLG